MATIRSAKDGNGKRFSLGSIVYIWPEPELGYWRVTEIVSHGRKGTALVLANRDNETTTTAWACHVQVI